MTMATVPVVTIDPHTRSYADQIGLGAAFDHMLVAVLQIIPGLRSIHVFLKPDWDVPGKQNIIWDIRMDPTTKEAFLAAYRSWHSELVRAIPQPNGHIFHLDMVRDTP